MDVIDLCESSNASTLSIGDTEKPVENDEKNSKKGNTEKSVGNDENCSDPVSSNRHLSPQSGDDDSSIISIRVAKAKSKSYGAAVNTDSRKEQVKLPRPQQRRSGGYGLNEGEKFVWATEVRAGEKGRAHLAIILHPQPDPPPGIDEGMVCIQWHNSRVVAWIPRINIENENGGDNKKEGASTNTNNGRKLSKRKRVATNRLVDTVAKESMLAFERAKMAAKKGRRTCCTNVESIAKPNRRAKLPANVSSAIAIAHAHGMATAQKMTTYDDERKPSATLESGGCRKSSKYDGEWWHKDQLGAKIPAKTKRQKQKESIGGQSIPVSLVSFDDDSSVSSTVTLELPDSDDEIDISGEDSDSCECKQNSSQRVVSSQRGCHVCDSHVHHHNLIDVLLKDWKTVPSGGVDEGICFDFITRFKVLLQGLEEDGCDGTSIFYHPRCEWSNAPNPIFTVAKLIQLFDGICRIVDIAISQPGDNGTSLSMLFRPSRKRKTNPNDCGVIIQMLRIATFEIVNSREDFVQPENAHNIDQLIGVTFGLQSLQTMARNTYFDSKLACGGQQKKNIPIATFKFLDQPLDTHKCIRRNCQVGHRPLIVCGTCGVRFHRSCLGTNENAANENADDKLVQRCTSCKASAQLLDASRTNNIADVYSLAVEKGASPLQPLSCDTIRNETALHAAVHSNNYDLASMMLFGSHLLLNCDDSLQGWDLPVLAWGRDGKCRTPFQSGIDTIKKNMDVRPPVEILLLLCGRGANETQDDIVTAIDTRQRMMLVLEGLDVKAKEKLLEMDISTGLEPVPIPVISSSGTMPSFRMYAGRSFESRFTGIRWFDCRCRKGRQLAPFVGDCTADSLKILHQKQKLQPACKAYCNYLCESRSNQIARENSCQCRLAEDGFHHGLEVFETPDGRGFALRTAKGVTIKKNESLCHYAGEIITSKEAKRRDQEYAANSHTGSYILDMDEKGAHCIDATHFRSAAALVNHSCSHSNCELFRALGNHLDANFPFLGLRAKQDIGELTELLFNYVKGSSGGKPTGFCSECQGEHCLCRQCKELAHR